MKIFRNSMLNAFVTGMIGFLIASFAGIFGSYLIFKLNIFRPFMLLIPDGQPLIRLYAGIVFVFLGVGVGGVVTGLIRGQTLYIIDPRGSHRRYLLGGAFAYGISGGLLLVPVLLILAFLSQYNPGSSKDPLTFLAVFTVIGALYGLFSGLLLVLLTLRLRYIWLPWLASIIGTALGGTLLGLVIWRQDSFLPKDSALLQSIVFLLFIGLALVGIAGGLIGIAYQWAASRRERTSDGSIAPRRWQDFLIVAAGILLVFLMVSVSGTLINFITVHTGTTTTSLGLEAQGVHWGSPILIDNRLSPQDPATFGLSIGPDSTPAVAWTAPREDVAQVFFAFGQVGDSDLTQLSPAVRVSGDPAKPTKNPQLVQDADGSTHLVWTEDVDEVSVIRYSRCQGEICSPSVELSGPGGTACKQAPEPGQNDYPAIAISGNGALTVTWNAGGWLAVTSWIVGEQPPQIPDTCLQPLSTDLQANQWQPRLTAWGQDGVAMVYSANDPIQDAPVALVDLTANADGSAVQIGQGGLAEINADPSGALHVAWCDAEGKVSAGTASGQIDKIDFPPCRSRPGIFHDSISRVHLLWNSDQVENNFAERSPENLIYESIRMEDGWSEPAIVASAGLTGLSAAASLEGTAYLIYQNSPGEVPALMLARQVPYQCSPANLSAVGRVVLSVVQSGEFHPQDYRSPFCDNRFDGFIYMPNPQPSFSSETPTENGGFDHLAELVQSTEYELLLSNMQWDQDIDHLSPGTRVVDGIAELYRQIKDDPARFPRGLTIRILLGNFPNMANFEWGDQIWNVVQELRDAGVEQLEDPSIGWKVEVANFPGTYPHSHTKFIIIDGKQLLSAGFNISWFHLPADHISGKGDGLTDLGMLITGPIAQEGVAVFDDIWTNANQLTCSDLQPGEPSDDWRQGCEWKIAQSGHIPEVLKYYLADKDQASFALYRTDVYKEADKAYTAALSAAQSSIDAIQVNFSADFYCILNIVSPGICDFENALPWMEALVNSVQENHTHVRVIVENANMNGLENRVGIAILQNELSRRGLSEFVEIRFFNGRLHAKSTLVDEELLFVGSQNFHYSSFGKSGLLEFVAATESPEAIQIYQEMFEYYWDLAVPSEQAVWGSSEG